MGSGVSPRRRARRRASAAAAVALLASSAAAQRPPLINDPGQRVFDNWAANVSEASRNATPALLALLAESAPSCRGLPCENATAEELLDLLLWEFVWGMGLIHNGPIYDRGNQSDDSAVLDNLSKGWIETIWQRVLQRKECFARPWSRPVCNSGAWQTYGTENSRFHYTPFAAGVAVGPTEEEANSRLLYVATNTWKKSIGDEVFGDTVYVISPSIFHRVLLAPYDTNHFAGYFPTLAVGVLQGASGRYTGVQHTLLQFLRFYPLFGHDFNFGQLLRQWYGPPGPPYPSLLTYPWFLLEPALVGAAWLPEHLMYQVARFKAIWGTPFGQTLQQQLKRLGRPLVWANNDTSGMVVDATVGGLGDPSDPSTNPVTPQLAANFAKLWQTPGLTWEQFKASAGPELHLNAPSYYDSRLRCADLYRRWDAQVMGTDGKGRCTWWRWQADRDGPFPGSYCCIDGGCQPCADGAPMPDCLRHCPTLSVTATQVPDAGDGGWNLVPIICVGVALCTVLALIAGGCWLCRRAVDAGAGEERDHLINAPSSERSDPSRRNSTEDDTRASSPSSLADLVGNLHPGHWRLRVKEMNLDVRVYSSEAAAAPAATPPPAPAPPAPPPPGAVPAPAAPPALPRAPSPSEQPPSV